MTSSFDVKMRRRRRKVPLVRLWERARGEGTGHGVTAVFTVWRAETCHDRFTCGGILGWGATSCFLALASPGFSNEGTLDATDIKKLVLREFTVLR